MAMMAPGRPAPDPTSIILNSGCPCPPCKSKVCACSDATASRAGRRAKESSTCIWKASSMSAAAVYKQPAQVACKESGEHNGRSPVRFILAFCVINSSIYCCACSSWGAPKLPLARLGYLECFSCASLCSKASAPPEVEAEQACCARVACFRGLCEDPEGSTKLVTPRKCCSCVRAKWKFANTQRLYICIHPLAGAKQSTKAFTACATYLLRNQYRKLSIC